MQLSLNLDLSLTPSCSRMQRVEHDFYPSDDRLVTVLKREVDIRGIVSECAAGDGAIARYFPGCITNDPHPSNGFEPLFGLDATKESSWIHALRTDWTVTNPPFTLAPQILPLAFKYSEIGVAFLLRISYLEPCKNRANWLKEHADHLSNYIIFNPRPKYRQLHCGLVSLEKGFFVVKN